jgi:hypothetical protein
VCQRNILLVSYVGCLKVDVACLFITVSISDGFVSVWKDTFSVDFRSKRCHEWKGVGFGTAVWFWQCDLPQYIL